jgi:membrane protein implicated in regulation of membrane protease activity
MEWLWWVGAAVVLGIVEMFILDVVVLMLIGGALAGALVTALGAPLWVQILVFCVVSVILFFTLRPWALRQFNKRTPVTETNASAQVGRRAVVVSDVSDAGGRVKLSGEVWTARTEGPGFLAAGTEVQVVRIDGATAVVLPVMPH